VLPRGRVPPAPRLLPAAGITGSTAGRRSPASLPRAGFGPAEHPTIILLARPGAEPTLGARGRRGGGERSSNGLPGLVNGLNVLLGFHAERGDAGAPLVHLLQRVLVHKGGAALVGRGGHGLHALRHGRGGVEEGVPRVGGLQGLGGSHEAGDAVDSGGTGDGRRQPGVQWEGVAHGPHVGRHGGPVEGEHRGVVELHGAGLHLLLPPPLGSSVLEPDLRGESQGGLD